MMPAPPAQTPQDPQQARAGLARALAEAQLEVQGAEHDLARLLHDGGDFVASRYGAQHLEAHPEDLDHWSWHHEPFARTRERGGIQAVPALPYHPV